MLSIPKPFTVAIHELLYIQEYTACVSAWLVTESQILKIYVPEGITSCFQL